MNKIKQYFLSFMYNRYGVDKLCQDMLICYLVIIVLNIFIKSHILYALSLIILIMIFLRMFSKNKQKRQLENTKYLKIKKSFTGIFSLRVKMFKERKTHVYRKCPNCKNTLRFPKKPGDHSAVCPCCKNRLDVHIK